VGDIIPTCLGDPLTFGEKLDVLRVECTKCARKGRYNVSRLIEKYGRKANMIKWKEQLNGDCPRRDARSMHERCDLICPDLPKVLLAVTRICSDPRTTFIVPHHVKRVLADIDADHGDCRIELV
jgi:hypothetical protein